MTKLHIDTSMLIPEYELKIIEWIEIPGNKLLNVHIKDERTIRLFACKQRKARNIRVCLCT